MMKGTKRLAVSDNNDSAYRNNRVMEGSSIGVERAEPSQEAAPPLDTQRAESSRQHVRALNTQFASWVQTQLKNHPDELWDDGIRDYLAHSTNIMEKFSDVVNWLKANAAKGENSALGSFNSEMKQVPESKISDANKFLSKPAYFPTSTSSSLATSWSSGSFSSSPSYLVSNSKSMLFSNSQNGVLSNTQSIIVSNSQNGLFSNSSGILSSSQSDMLPNSQGGLFSNTSGMLSSSQSGISSNSQSGVFSNSQSGVFSSSQSGMFSNSQGGMFSNSQGGMFSNSQGGTFSNSQGGTFSNSQGGMFTNSHGGTFSNSHGGTFSNSHSGVFSNSQSGMFSNKTPASFGTQSHATNNQDASDDVDGEIELEQPSSPSVKKSEEKGTVVVHEVKCKLFVKSSDPADKGSWKDKGTGQLSVKCKEGASKGTKESKPTVVVRNDVGKVILNALLYPGIKTNLQKNSLVTIFHTVGDDGNNESVVAHTFLIRTKTLEDRDALAAIIQEHAPPA